MQGVIVKCICCYEEMVCNVWCKQVIKPCNLFNQYCICDKCVKQCFQGKPKHVLPLSRSMCENLLQCEHLSSYRKRVLKNLYVLKKLS